MTRRLSSKELGSDFPDLESHGPIPKINIVIPMAGLGSRFLKAGYTTPKPFLDLLGKPMIQHVIENLDIPGANYILIVRKEHLAEYRTDLEKIMGKRIFQIVEVEKLTEGAACTVLHAHRLINNDVPLLIANSDQIVDIDITNYASDCQKRGLDGSILTFIDSKRDPKWSFAKVDGSGLVTEVKEKVPISEYATVGIYLFSKGRYFVEYSIDMIIRNERVNNEFYVCPVYNYLIKDGMKIGIFNILESQMHGTGTPEDLDIYLKFLFK